MNQADRLADMLGGALGDAVRKNAGRITELRLRGDRPARLSLMGGGEVSLDVIDAAQLHKILNRLMENSLYACEMELRQGYFTCAGGLRVGVCGKMNVGRQGVEHLANVGSVCIRIPREARGCADALAERMFENGLSSVIVLSPPGMGKTTLIRDLARIASERGMNVAVADERREIAACREGVPQLDVGSRTDVMDGCPKAEAMPMLVRACAPDLLVADEIGSRADAEAIRDAARCGVRVAATAHAGDLREALRREQIAPLIRDGVFDWCAVLGPEPGKIKSLERWRGEGVDAC